MKKCSKCGRSDVGFHRDASQADGLDSHCRECAAASDAARYAKDPEKAKAYRREYAAKNADAIRAKRIAKYAANADKERARVAKYRAQTVLTAEAKARRAQRTKEYDAAHKPEAKARKEKWYAENREHALAYRAEHADRARDLRFRREFGITLADYRQMLKTQGGVCAICKTPPLKKWLSVDHCHDTAAVRGLLCQPCNIAIGWLKHSTTLLESAKDYIRPPELHPKHEDLMLLM